MRSSAMKAGAESNYGRAAIYDSKASYTRKQWVKTGEQRQTSAETNSKTDTYTDLADGSSGIAKSVLVPDKISEAAGAGLSAASMAWRRAGGFSGQLSADDFTLALSAFEEFGEGKIFSNPKIIVSNGRMASLRIHCAGSSDAFTIASMSASCASSSWSSVR